MPDLLYLDITQNSNPDFLNIILSYPTRITILNTYSVELYGLDPDLHPRSAENIKQITIRTQFFLTEDYHSLARLDFPRLEHT